MHTKAATITQNLSYARTTSWTALVSADTTAHISNEYFASLDLRSSYWQIVINEWNRHKTAFTWRARCYQYTRLTFGLTSAGQISHCIAEVLATVLSRDNISFYIDDNLVHSKTFKQNILALEQLFTALHKFGLKLNSDKCIFLASEVKFLGRRVNDVTREKCKGNYGKRAHWPIGHCKRGKRQFELVFIDFVTMPDFKGKCYILIILNCLSWHFTAIPCARDRVIDAVRGQEQFFLCHREMPHIIYSDRGTHFTVRSTGSFATKYLLHWNFTVPGCNIPICMQKYSQHNNDERNTVL